MHKIFKLIFIKIILLVSVNCFAEFAPVSADVTAGDESIKNSMLRKHDHESVYGASQTGSFFMIRFFQKFISPQSGPSCKFSPTCSSYGRQSVQKHGAWWGSLLAGERIIRCNPFNHQSGEDKVPERLFGK